MYAQIIIEYPVKSLDKMFTYMVPYELQEKLKVGMKVFVPFGSKNVNGFVLKITDEHDNNISVKEIIDIIDENFVLNDELLKIGKFMKEKTLCTLISAYQAMLPTSYKAKTQKRSYDAYNSFIKLNVSTDEVTSYIESNKRSVKQNELLNYLIDHESISKKEVSLSVFNSLLSKGLIKEKKEEKYRILAADVEDKKYNLTNQQQQVSDSVVLNKKDTYLLYGVTGSGKTEVYLDLIEKVIKEGKTAIVLTPEISLTMQIVKRFYARFKNRVAVFHSALSDGEKHDEYKKIIKKEVDVVVGTRSAIFTPLVNVGVIIIDEEHSDTYKQDNNPRYSAKDIANFRNEYHNCPLVLGSATPTLESMARASKGVYKLLTLENRVGSAGLPNVNIISMEEEMKKRNYIFSDFLTEKITEKISKDEQVILLLNRRGFSTYITCSSCGHSYKCPNCDITLTYHKTKNNLVCHYCGYFRKKDDLCPECHEDALSYLGLGTEKLEEYISSNFPLAKVLRMDQDTTSKKGAHDKIIESFKNKEYNILLGTQMISKGLDFKDVTLVGVINADASLNVPDYKANENTFALLNQVAGRAGRSVKKGEVVFQTFNANNYVLKCAALNDYMSFYKYEMQFRHKLSYPPYYYLVGIKFVSKDFELALLEAKKAVAYMKNNFSKNITVLGPTTAAILKHNNYYRFQVILKYKTPENLFSVLKELDIKYSANNKVDVQIDFNPNKI